MTSLSRHTLEQIVALSSEGVLVLDAHQGPRFPVVYANAAYQQLTGYSVEELLGHGWPLLEPNGDEGDDAGRLRAALGKAEPCRLVLPDVRKDGTTWQSEIELAPLYGGPGDLRYFLCLQRPAARVDEGAQQPASTEVSLLQRELGRARKRIVSLARNEPVTGVLKYGYFLELAQRDFRMARRDDRAITVLLFEIVDLDVYRKTFGTKAADSCLRMIAAQVAGALKRAGDLCARVGDASIVALVHGQDLDAARALAHRIADNVRGLGLHNPRSRAGRYVMVRTGVAGGVPAAGDEPDAMVARARRDLAVGTEPESGGGAAYGGGRR